LIFFLGGRGRGRGAPGCVLLRGFMQDERAPNSPVCVIYYMLSSGGFAATCLQSIAKGGFSILGHPGQTRVMFQASTARRPVHTLTTTEGLLPSFRHGLHGAVGMIFLCIYGLCCYMLYVYYMLYACYMSSSEPSSGSSGSVWLYRRAIFGQKNWMCARTPCTIHRRDIFGKKNWPCARTPCTLIGA
jgi:hypothetical protein